jgi:UDP-2,4-diacetamido-2,4,6-trideoxy-beta-L-altropyranose hydrolase
MVLNSSFIFRVDASVQIGTGHVMRCITLAKALEKRNASCVFVCQLCPGNNIEFIRSYGFKVLEIEESNGDFNFNIDAKNTLNVISDRKFDWLIIDHYGIDIYWELQVQSIAKKTMVIDDLANRRHKCDLLLDQNIRINADARYASLIPSECLSFFGPSNVILRSEFDGFNINYRNGEINSFG